MRETVSGPLVLALGSNLGDRLENLCSAVRDLQGTGIHLEAFSSVVETPPIGYLDQPPFLNMVASASTYLPPRRVLSIFQGVEERAGRRRDFPNAPRTLDLDLLFFRGRILREEGLRVPHRRWKERSFVVRPLAETSPHLRDPETGWQVQEVARLWPMEPQEIRIVASPEAFQEALKEWTR
ncbi:MAG: 2-amino-4-hydroxy-6-hydroxymethyldihydropteridine diphosphokinase [Gemmatimonadota bacterium]